MSEWRYEQMNAWIDKLYNECMNGQMSAWINKQINA